MTQSDINANTPVVSPKPAEPPLSEDVMKALGFTSFWPMGNATQPWWEHAAMGIRFRDGLPTGRQLLTMIYAAGIAEGEESIRSGFRQLMRVPS